MRSSARRFLLASSLSLGCLVPLAHADDPGSTIASAAGTWRYLPTLPEGRIASHADYDPIGDRMLVHGGTSATTIGDAWWLSFSPELDWKRFFPATAGPSCDNAAHVFDPVRNQWILFGGALSGIERSNATFALSLGGTPDWTQLAPTGTVPSAREAAAAIRDPMRDRMVIFGGSDSDSINFNDVYAFDLASAAWSPVTVAGTPPSARSLAAAIYDAARDRIVLFGGVDQTMKYQEVWTVNFSGTPTWTLLSTTGTPPAARSAAGAVYDDVNDRMIVFGGITASTDVNDTWSLSLATGAWTQLDSGANGPPKRPNFAHAYDSQRRRMLVFGGARDSYSHYRDTWALSLDDPTHWTLVEPGQDPLGRRSESAVMDVGRDRMILYGGVGQGGYADPVTALDLGPAMWNVLQPAAGPYPPSREAHSAIIDPVGDRMIVFGGYGGTFMNDAWSFALNAPAWTSMVTSGTRPSPRRSCSAVYDAPRHRMLVYGGFGDNGHRDPNVYVLDLATSTWSVLGTVGDAGLRIAPAMIYDPLRDRLVIVGGTGVTPEDAWVLNLSGTPTWTQLAPTGSPPARASWKGMYDPFLDRMIFYDGRNTVMALSLSGTPAWSTLTAYPIDGGQAATAEFDRARNRMLVHGGMTVNGAHTTTQDEVYELSFASTLPVPDPLPVSRTRIAQVRPNPGRDDQTIVFDVAPGDAAARLEVFSVTGERIWSRHLAGFATGTHTLRWNGADARGRRCGPGVFWARVVGSRGTSSQRFVRIR